jgi:gamma-glutamyltranspeptidase/glutathione hydrolase
MNGKRPSTKSLHGMVAAGHPLAAEAGAQLLSDGGNAFDAAAAVAAALGVVEPAMSSLAGMGMATCWIAAEQQVRVLDFIGHVPFDFPADRFTSIGQLNRGAFSCGVPGNLAGWAELIASYGKKSLGDALEPATALAQDGFPLGDYTADAIRRTANEAAGQPLFDEWRRTYSQPAGTVLRQPDLARTFASISLKGRALVDCVSQAGGCITSRDLAAVQPTWVAPLDADYRGWMVHVPPPPSEAFQYLMTLRILDGFDLARFPRGCIDHLDLVWRAVRLAAGVRVRCNASRESIAAAFSTENILALRVRVSDDRPIEGQTEQFPDPIPPDPSQDHTTSFSVADRAGNLICCTQTLGVAKVAFDQAKKNHRF